MSGRWHFYADDTTRAALAREGMRVLLVGSFMGYPNFGDILQLKGAIRWHRSVTRCEPVLILDVDAIADADYAARVRRNFAIEPLVFACVHPLTNPPFGLREIEAPPTIERLHLYGGGFLNRLWGDFVLSLVEGVYAVFNVSRYIITGQQVDPEFKSAMARHFAICPPIIAGGRDPTSARVLAECGVRAAYSFDDAAECMADIAAALGSGKPAASEPHALIHLNASGYTRSDDEDAQLGTLRERVIALRDHLGHAAPLTLLQAYTDRRLHSIADTLGVVQLLDDTLPLREYRVLHLDRIALEFGQAGWDRGARISPAPTIALTSSYHVSMLCALMGVPCWMERRNAYYRQKASGLYMAHATFEEFLGAPTVASLDEGLAARTAWLASLAQAWAGPAPGVLPRTAVPHTDATAREWAGKMTPSRMREHLRAWIRDAESSAQRANVCVSEQTARAVAAEASLDAAMRTLGACRAELTGVRADADRLSARVAELGEQNARTSEDLAATREQLYAAQASARRLSADLANTQVAMARLDATLRDEISAWRRQATSLGEQIAREREHAARIRYLCDSAVLRLRRITMT